MPCEKPLKDAPDTVQAAQPSHTQSTSIKQQARPVKKKAAVDRSFARAANEDDDGYDPWSDRPAKREPLFQADPWN